MCKLSVLVPVYKVEKYIERCSVSLFNQTFSDIEFIFVDDNTPDSSVEILRNVIQRYPNLKNKVKIIKHEENKGLAMARYTGLLNAKGDFVVFCDSDDWVENDMYEHLYNVIEKTDSDIVYSNYYIEYINKTSISDLKSLEKKEDYLQSLLQGDIPCFTPIRIYRKKLLISHINELYVYGINMWEDMLMNIVISCYSKKISFTPYVGYHYFQGNPNSYTSLWSLDSIKNMLQVMSRVSIKITDMFPDYKLPLIFFRLNAQYSIFSHTLYSQMKSISLFDKNDEKFILKNPNMNILNKFFMYLIYNKYYRLAYIYINIKKRIIKYFF